MSPSTNKELQDTSVKEGREKSKGNPVHPSQSESFSAGRSLNIYKKITIKVSRKQTMPSGECRNLVIMSWHYTLTVMAAANNFVVVKSS